MENIEPPASDQPLFEKFVKDYFEIKIKEGYRVTKKEYSVAEDYILSRGTPDPIPNIEKQVLKFIEEDTLSLTLKCAIEWRDKIFPDLNPYIDHNREPGIGVEAWREMDIPKLDMKVRGILDVIEGDEYLGASPIYRDLKVIKTTPRTLSTKEQYIFYSAMCHSKTQRFPIIKQDSIIKLKKPIAQSSSITSYEPLQIVHTREDLMVLFERLRIFRECVTSKKFVYPPAPHGSWHCSENFCEFHGLCKDEKLVYDLN